MNENNTNENIVIPIKIERVKLWTRRALQAVTWLICLGLLAASAAVTVSAALAWLVSGSEIILALGCGWRLAVGVGRRVASAAPARPGRQTTAGRKPENQILPVRELDHWLKTRVFAIIGPFSPGRILIPAEALKAAAPGCQGKLREGGKKIEKIGQIIDVFPVGKVTVVT